MPYKKRYAKRRPYRRRRRKQLKRYKKMPPLGGFPTSMKVRLKYVETFSLNPSASVASIQVYRANSLFDPNLTGVGHQPSNFDKLATIYDRYTVVGSKIRIYPNWLSSSAVSPPPVVVCALTEDGTDLATVYTAGGVDNVLEQPRITRFIKPLTNANVGGRSSIVKTFSGKKFFKVKSLIGVSPYTADIAANPSEGAFFEIGAFSPDGSVDPASQSFRVEIEYIAIFTEPKLTDAS